ncbi:MAG: hypothetical protein QY307_06895 [Acidimicrobiia bacterium]|nr:MAG: hypothetical protein QY307_06895 [Acidimicrobiia bacterium]
MPRHLLRALAIAALTALGLAAMVCRRPHLPPGRPGRWDPA